MFIVNQLKPLELFKNAIDADCNIFILYNSMYNIINQNYRIVKTIN